VWNTYVTDVRNVVDAESDAYRESTPSSTADTHMIVVLVVAAVCLTMNSFLASGRDASWLVSLLDRIDLDGLAARLGSATTTSANSELNRLAFWALVQIAGYVVLPVVVVVVVFRERLRDYGLRVRGISRDARPYALLLVLALPGIIAMSYTPAFQARYPFYDLAPGEAYWPNLWLWWGLYAVQFVALEFFFRGFMLHGLAHRFGWGAIFIMVVPYNMLHYGKPMPEALAAIAGGVVLGDLSLKTKSIWWGAALHIGIAAAMDMLSLWHRGLAL